MQNNNGRGKCHQPSRRSRLITLTLFVVVVLQPTTLIWTLKGPQKVSVLTGSAY